MMIPRTPWHATEAREVLDALDSSADGLSGVEADRRLDRYGPNTLRATPPVSPWHILLVQFSGAIVWLLVAAMLIAYLSGERLNAAAIAAVLALNVALGFSTELRARRAMEALIALDVPSATVLRGGKRIQIDARLLVPGDIILVEAGDAVAADARIVQSAELRASEAALTGEALPVDKRATPAVDEETPLPERATMLYKASHVLSGTGHAVVVATGMATEVGEIGELVAGIAENQTPLERQLDILGRRLAIVAIAVAALIAGLHVLQRGAIADVLQMAIAVAIAAVPEGLPVVATIAMAVGVRRMARRRALIRRLPTVETLGSATVICTDKTGTLTGGEMTVTSVLADGKEWTVSGSGYAPMGIISHAGRPADLARDAVLAAALRIGLLANRADAVLDGSRWLPLGDPTEAALVTAARKSYAAQASGPLCSPGISGGRQRPSAVS